MNEQIFVFAGILCLVWLFYMATFRTGDFLALMKADQDRRARQAKALGAAAKFGLGAARLFMKK
jgi:hypothetical protein